MPALGRNRTCSASEGQPAHLSHLRLAPNAHSAHSRTLLAHRSARRIAAAGRGQQTTERAGWSSTNEHPRHVLTAAAAVQTRSASAIASYLTAPFARQCFWCGGYRPKIRWGACSAGHQRMPLPINALTACFLSYLHGSAVCTGAHARRLSVVKHNSAKFNPRILAYSSCRHRRS